MAALHDRGHLYKLPDSIAGSIQNWRCFIGRGGRARLECIDHVTHETFTAVKAEAQAVAAHYQVGWWTGRLCDCVGQGVNNRHSERLVVQSSSRQEQLPMFCCSALLIKPRVLLLPPS